ncbi:retrotransposon ORF1 [Tanacetum coccineum]
MSGPIPSIFLRNPIIIEGFPYNLKIPCNIGHAYIKKAYIDLNSPLNIMTRMMYNWIMRRKLNPKEDANGGIRNFTSRIKGMHVFIGNFTYVIDFMIVEDICSILNPRLSQVVLGRPFIETSNMTHDPPEGVVRFIKETDEVAYKMPHKIEQYDSLSDLEKEHTKSVYLRNEEDKRRGVEYVMSKILGFYKECLELGLEYLTGVDDEGEVTMSRLEFVYEKTWHVIATDVESIKRVKKNAPELVLSDEAKKNYCLLYIEHMLLSNNKSLKNIPNMSFPTAEYTMDGYNRLVHDELSYNTDDLKLEHKRLYVTLTDEQKGIYRTIMDCIDKNKGGMLFVYEYDGIGKTYLYKTMSVACHSKEGIILNVASSGITTLLLEGGRTAHSRFAIPINVVEDLMCNISVDSELAELLRMTKLIIWDEAPMVNRHCYEAFDRIMRDICRTDPSTPSEQVFGRKVVVFGGLK